jgi:8-oxo-dGTP pyrophosphatase MutT (NUDIX family)
MPTNQTKKTEDKIGGWKTRSSDVVYDNPWIQIRHEEVQRPNGSEGIYGVVHFKSRAIGIVAIDSDDNIFLVKQSRYPNNETTIELPEGGGPLDEEPLEAAKRELEEETGLLAENWQFLLELRTSNSVTDEIAYIYTAEDLKQGTQQLEETEDIDVLKVPFQKAVDMVMCGDIVDAMSVAAILKVALQRKS